MNISYIVTIYNKARYLPFMLEGLRRQEGAFDREYLFIDDGRMGKCDDRRARKRRPRGGDQAVFVHDYSIELQLALRTHFAEIHDSLFFMPDDPSGRITESMTQLLHDSNMALAGFLPDEPDLSDKIRRAALRRAVSRAWGWARRRGKARLFSRDHKLFLAERLGLVPATAETIIKTCEIFCETDNIRFPPKAAEQATLSRTGARAG